MKIYHTETQADYDALMVELEAEGAIWSFGRKLSESNNWYVSEHLTCIRVYDSKVNHASLNYYKEEYPDTPITKYKAKADDKMKFTKENVVKVVDEYFWQADLEPCSDLIAEIYNLDGTPEKVGVPKYITDYLIKAQDEITLMRVFEIANAENELKKWKKEYDWIRKNSEKFAKSWIDGYTIEPEQLYYIPLPYLETSDGIQQVLSQRKGEKNYFACRPAETLKQRFTKEELEQVPEIYKPFAKLIEEEAND